MVFNFNGLFHKAINKQAKQGKRTFYSLLNKVRKLRLPADLALELFDYIVIPVMLYGCEVWGFRDVEQLEVLHRKFMKIIMGINQSTPNCMVYGESGKYTIRTLVNARMINFFSRTINGSHNKLSFIMYKLARKKQLQEVDYYSCWSEHIEYELRDLGMYDLWLNEGNGFNNVYIKESVKLRLHDMYKQSWNESVTSHDYCDFYRQIKNEWGKMKYLSNLSFYQRRILCKWRCRSNKLPVSSSRFTITDDVICQ